MPNITKNIISDEKAKQLAPTYYAFIKEQLGTSQWSKLWRQIDEEHQKLRKGQSVITFSNGKFIIAKVTQVNFNDFRAVDGPVVRVTNGEFSWRVDGNHYCFPIDKAKLVNNTRQKETNPVNIIKNLVKLIEKHNVDGGPFTQDAKAFVEDYEQQLSYAEDHQQ